MKRKWESAGSLSDSTEEIDYEINSDEELHRHSGLPMDSYFNTELHCAASNGDTLKCAELLENYPDAATDTNDQSLIPLDLAAIGGHFEACEVILSYMEYQDIYGERPCGNTTLELILMEAVINEKHFKIFETLINNLPEIAEFGIINFSSLLYLAASKGCKQICEILLEKKPGIIGEENYFYLNPIHVAAINGHSEIVELFISCMPREDIISTLYSERRYDGSLNADVSCSPFILKCISNMTAKYPNVHLQAGIYNVNVNEDNVKGLYKLLKLYKDLSTKKSFKIHLGSPINDKHRSLIDGFDKYILQNLFYMKTICKKISDQYPFNLLNRDCTEYLTFTIMKICYPALDVHITKDPISCAGQDSNDTAVE
jgi:hypothetical protein